MPWTFHEFASDNPVRGFFHKDWNNRSRYYICTGSFLDDEEFLEPLWRGKFIIINKNNKVCIRPNPQKACITGMRYTFSFFGIICYFVAQSTVLANFPCALLWIVINNNDYNIWSDLPKLE